MCGTGLQLGEIRHVFDRGRLRSCWRAFVQDSIAKAWGSLNPVQGRRTGARSLLRPALVPLSNQKVLSTARVRQVEVPILRYHDRNKG